MMSQINSRYTMHEVIDEGGMGVVYRAYDRLTGRTVAIKRVNLSSSLQVDEELTIGTSEDDLRLALTQEFQILAGLRHPNIITVYDYGFDDQRQPFFVMEYVEEGQTLVEAARGLPFEGKIGLVQKLLQALIYLHRRSVLHCDLKPENVLVNKNGLKVLDFGLALAERSRGMLTGTPIYMAPEQIEESRYSTGADLYVVGILLYQILTGRHPFEPFDSRFFTRLMISSPDLSEIDSRLHPFLKKLMARDPKERFKRARIVLNELAAALGLSLPSESLEIRDSYLEAARFIGRDEELNTLTAALNDTQNRTGSAWLLGGESGVGKSRLLRELKTRALVSGFQVFEGRSVEEHGGQLYQLWRAPLRHVAASSSDLTDLEAGVLLPLVPDLETILERPIPPPPELEGEAGQIRLYTTIARLFRDHQKPTLLILENLHLASESLLPLKTVCHMLDKQNLMVIGSYRHDEMPDLPDTLTDMRPMLLERLTAIEMADLSAAMLGELGKDQRIVSFIQRETEGNTFFAIEVVRSLANAAGGLGDIGQLALPEHILPNGIRDIIQRRLAKLPQRAVDYLTQAAVVGRVIEFPLLQLMLREGAATRDEDLDQTLRDWWIPLCADAAILEIVDGSWQFAHGKIREELLLSIAAETLQALNRYVAEGVEHLYPDDINQAARLAFHWDAAGVRPKVAKYATQAGRQAADQFAHQEAARFFETALAAIDEEDDEQRYQLMIDALTAYIYLADKERRDATLSQLLTLAEKLDSDEKRVEALYLFADSSVRSGKHEEGIVHYNQALELAERTENLQRQANIFARLALIYAIQRKLDEALAFAQRGHKLALELELDLLISEYSCTLGNIYIRNREFEKGLNKYFEALEISTRLKHLRGQLRDTNLLALAHHEMGDLGTSRRYFKQSLALCKQTGDVYWEMVGLNNYALLLTDLGEYEVSIQHFLESFLLCRQLGDQLLRTYLFNNIGVAYHRSGQFGLAVNAFEQAIIDKQALGDNWSEAYTLNRLGHVLVDLNQTEDAHQTFRRAEQLLEDVSLTEVNVETWCWLARVNGQVGLDEDLSVYAEKAWEAIESKGFNGTWDWASSALNLYRAFSQLDDPRAPSVLKLAHAELQSQAEKISDPETKENFLERIDSHRQISRLYAQLSS